MINVKLITSIIISLALHFALFSLYPIKDIGATSIVKKNKRIPIRLAEVTEPKVSSKSITPNPQIIEKEKKPPIDNEPTPLAEEYYHPEILDRKATIKDVDFDPNNFIGDKPLVTGTVKFSVYIDRYGKVTKIEIVETDILDIQSLMSMLEGIFLGQGIYNPGYLGDKNVNSIVFYEFNIQ